MIMAGYLPWIFHFGFMAWLIQKSCCALYHPECYTDPRGTDYRGIVAVTTSGKTCQKWTSQSPHTHSRTPSNFPNAGLGDHNFCRNPDEAVGAWCYTTDSDTESENCNIGQAESFCGFDAKLPYANCAEFEAADPAVKLNGISQKVFCTCPHTDGYRYVGCFVDSGDRAVPDHQMETLSLTISMCATHCQNHGSRYFSVQTGNTCFCGSDGISYNRHGAALESQCNVACTGDATQKCGGQWRNNVYDLWVNYIGCFTDAEERQISNFELEDASMTSQKCIDHCKSKGQAYAATQDSDECRCGDKGVDYAKYGKVAESDCDRPCAGNSDEMCGGIWKMSVYSIEEVNCKGYQSCSKLLEAGFEDTGYYEIDPDGPGTGVASFLVFCEMCTTITPTTTAPVTELPGCISGYSSFEKSCYKLYNDKKSKTEAETECANVKAGTHLVDITSQQEQDFVAQMLSDAASSDAWLGLTASGYKAPLYWSDGSPLVFTAWDTYGRNEGLTCVRLNAKQNYKWGDYYCYQKLRYVCEYEVTPEVVPRTAPPPSQVCKGVTVIDHRQTRTSDFLEVKNKPGEIVVPITYKPSLEQISALLAASDSCQQYIRYDCQNSKIWDASGWPYVWWKSRQGRDMFNFGAVTTGSEGCECGQRNLINCPTSEKLGVEDGRIVDSAITASSNLNSDHDAPQGRLNHKQPTTEGSDSWVAAKSDTSPWIQAEFSELTWVSGVMLQGRGDYNQWVQTYTVNYTSDNNVWMQVKDTTNTEIVFTGNTDRNTIVTSTFPSRVLAKAVRIHPKTWYDSSEYGRYVSLRFELLGCRPGCTTQNKKCNCDGLNSIWEKDDGYLTDRRQLPLTTLRYGGNDKSKYTIGPLECNGTRSLSKRSCSELWSDGVRIDMEYEIDPDGPDGLGPPFTVFCKLSQAAPIMRSCEELRLAGYANDGYYDIDPDGPGTGELPFTVFCVISEIDAKTRIHHDSESKGRVIGYKDPGDFVLSPNYMAWSLEQMRNLIGVSVRCFQDIKYDCYNSKLFNSDKATDAEAWWISGDNGKMVNWGGVPTGKFGCSCYPDVCQNKLGLEDKTIPDSSMTASTELLDPNDGDQIYYARKGRLNGVSFWTPDQSDFSTCWIQVNFAKSTRINGLITQGSAWWNYWVTTLKVQYKIRETDPFITIPQTFDANTDASTPKTILFQDTIDVVIVRVKPITYNKGVGMRFEILGCEPDVACTDIDGNNPCKCDDDNDNTWKEDGGLLTDKDTLPVMKVFLANTETSTRAGYHTLGPLTCLGKSDTYPLYRTCAELVCAGHQRNGYYLLDSDGSNTGDDPYIAYCDMENNGVTILSHNHPSTIDMTSTADKVVPVNYAATTNQLKALGSLSESCRQHLKFSCKQFPIWGTGLHLSWNSINGQKMNNWGGTATKNIGCACWLSEGCSSSGKYCNCDINDDTMRVDKGWITDKQVLPVTSLNAKGTANTDSVRIVTLGSFECEGSDLPSPLRTCDEYMNAGFGSGLYQIDPDGPEGSLTAFIVHCDKGATVIHHDSEERRLATGNGDNNYSQTVKRTVNYRATMDQIQAVMDVSLNCRQFIKYECLASTIGDSHWVSREGETMNNWGNVANGETSCECGLDGSCHESDKKCNCLSGDDIWRFDEGYLSDKSKLPVSQLVIGDIDGVTEFAYYTLGPLECFKKSQVVTLQSCHQLKRQGGYSRSGYYDIDPDGAGTGVEPFAVYCDMTDGSTIIGHNRKERTLVRDTARENVDVEYTATLDQIQALIDISSHCQQHLSYECHKSGLFGADLQHIAFWKHGTADDEHYNFGGVDMGLLGCPCGFNGSCGDANVCKCNGQLGKWERDSGLITNRNQLPVVFMRFGDTDGNQEKGFYTLGKLQCSNKEFSSCAELRDSGYLTDGYYPINSELRFCKMTQQGICPVYRTGPNFLYQYRFLELADHVSSFEFSVEAESDVFISLSTLPSQPEGLIYNSGRMYQIAIKHDGLDQVKIQRCSPSCELANSTDMTNLLNDNSLTQFYISFADGLIEVGHVGKSSILSYNDGSPIKPIKYVGFSSGSDKEAEWRFHEYLCNGFRKLVLRPNIGLIISDKRTTKIGSCAIHVQFVLLFFNAFICKISLFDI